MTVYQNIKTTELENSEVEITGELNTEVLESSRKKAIAKFSKNASIEGFRKGNIPENILVKHVGEMPILEEAAHLALQEHFPAILKESGVPAIGHPQVTITKLAQGEPIGFKITVAIMPTVTLPDYTKIASEVIAKHDSPAPATDKEVEETIEQIRKNKALFDANQKAKDADTEKKSTDTDSEPKLPEVTDEFVKTLGDFKDVTDFKSKLKENITKEKEQKAHQARRAALVEELVKNAKINVPGTLIEMELAKMLAGFKDDVAKANLTYEDYLKQINKTEEDIRKEWRPNAKKSVKLQLILNNIASEEKITADKDILEKETKHLVDMYKDAEPDRVRAYVETQLVNQKVFEFLEKAEKKK